MNPENNNQPVQPLVTAANVISTPPVSPVVPTPVPVPMAQPQTLTYAGFWKRLAAALIDGSLFVIVDMLLSLLFVAFLSPQSTQIVLPIIEFLIAIIYFASFESSSKQATIGKMIVGIVVTDIQGNKISFGRGIGRYLGKIISTVIIFIGFIMVGFTAKKQGLHDIIAGTLVVQKRKVGNGMIFLWTIVSLIISGVVVFLIVATLFASLFGGALFSTLDNSNASVGASTSITDYISPLTKAQYDAYLSQSLSSDIITGLDSPSTTTGPLAVSYDGTFIQVDMPYVPNLDGVSGSSHLDIKDIISKTGQNIDDAKSDFETDHFFTSLDFTKETDPSVYLNATRQINLIDGASATDIAKIDGDVVLVLPTSDMGTTTETYPFTLSF